MRRIDLLINHVRQATENTDVDDSNNIGISDNEFIQYFNDAQSHLQSMIVQQHPDVFSAEYEITMDGSESYSVPTNTLLENKITNVEYSSTGNSDDYYVLEETSLKNRSPGSTGSPSFYIRSSGKIIPVGKPSSGKLRVTYIKKLPTMDKRRGYIAALDLIGADPTKIEAISTGNTQGYYDLNLTDVHEHLSVVDDYGNIELSNIRLKETNVNSKYYLKSAGQSVSTYHLLGAGETITIGNYAVGGEYSTTHSQLPDIAEKYLIAYVEWKILKRDSSMDSGAAMQELMQMQKEIVDSYKHIDDDVQMIPEINQFDDWSIY